MRGAAVSGSQEADRLRGDDDGGVSVWGPLRTGPRVGPFEQALHWGGPRWARLKPR